MSLITISITSQGKTKEVTKKQEKVEVEKVEQEGPRGGKKGEVDGEEEEVEDGDGRTKTETRKERNNKGGRRGTAGGRDTTTVSAFVLSKINVYYFH